MTRIIPFLFIAMASVVQATIRGRSLKMSSKKSMDSTSSGMGHSYLFTPTLWAVQPDAVACNLTNLSNSQKTVRTRLIRNGEVLKDSGAVLLASYHTLDLYAGGNEEGGPIFCEFQVEGRKSSYRGIAKLFTLPNSSDFAAVAAT